MASPNNEYRRNTKNSPITEQRIAIATPEINALCMKLYDKISRVILNDDAYAPALKPQNIV